MINSRFPLYFKNSYNYLISIPPSLLPLPPLVFFLIKSGLYASLMVSVDDSDDELFDCMIFEYS